MVGVPCFAGRVAGCVSGRVGHGGVGAHARVESDVARVVYEGVGDRLTAECEPDEELGATK